MPFKEVILCEKGTQAKVFVKILKLDKVKKIGKIAAVFYNETTRIAVVHQSGHLLEQCPPETYEPRLAKNKMGWDKSLLPVIPALGQWKLKLKVDKTNAFFSERIEALFTGIKWAMVDNGTPEEISIAVDNDKEGELLGWEILDYFGLLKHPNISRLIYSANTDEGIMKAYKNKDPGSKWFSRYQAGLARSYADWIAGMNMTIAITADNQGFLPPYQPMHTGRVILAIVYIVALRQKAIEDFKPQDFFMQKVKFTTAKGESYWASLAYPDNWLEGAPERMLNENRANAVQQALMAKPNGTVVRYDKSDKKKLPPIGFHRTGFERFMIRKHSVALDPLGDALQSLYSEKALITYPRVEVKNLDTSMHTSMPLYISAVLSNLLSCQQLNEEEKNLYRKAEKIIDLSIKSSIWVSGVDEKESHHAIIPTNIKRDLHDLTPMEFLAYREICDRLIIQFMPPYEYASTIITTEVTLKNIPFHCKTTGSLPINLGWKSLSIVEDEDESNEKGDDDDDENQKLPLLSVGDNVNTSDAKLIKKTTECPKLYTVDGLLQDMESPNKFVQNKELLKKIKKLQIGTGGTRKEHIKQLVAKGFVEYLDEGKGKKKKTYLKPTEKLIALNSIAPDYFKLPETSAYWEDSFNEIQYGELSVAQFMDRQVKIMNRFMQDLANGKFKLKRPISDLAQPCQQDACKGFIFPRLSKAGKQYWECGSCNTRHFDSNGQIGGVMGDSSPRQPPVRSDSDRSHKCPACKKAKVYFKEIPGKTFNIWSCDGCGTAFFDKDGQLGSQMKGKGK